MPILRHTMQDLENRRSDNRSTRHISVLFHHEMAETLNLSSGGARLIVKSSSLNRGCIPILLETAPDEYAGLLCTPRWEQKLSENLYVVGVSFPPNQDDLALLRDSLAPKF